MSEPNASARGSGLPPARGGNERTRRWGRPAWSAVAATLLVALGATLSALRDREAGPDGDRYPVGPAPRSDAVRRVALSFKAVLADLYWIRAVQHYGRTRLAGGGAEDFAPLYPLLDVATTLDPRFDAAYRLGAVFLAEPSPGGPGRPDLALALLRKGMDYAPERWEYLQDLGFVHYWWLHDPEGAARWFERAADLPGGPLVAPAAGRRHAGGGGRTVPVHGRSGRRYVTRPGMRGCAARRSGVWPSSMRSTRWTATGT